MKNLYFNSIAKKLKHVVVLLVILFGFSNTIDAQVRKAFTQRTSSYSPTRKIYNVKGDFTMLGNTCLTPQNYTDATNNNDASMIYVDTDSDSNTFNSSSSTLVIPSENGSTPACSNIVFAGLYWTGKSSSSATFDVTKAFPSSQAVNNDYNVDNGDAITNSTYSLAVSRGGSTGDRYPIYTFSSGGTNYAFRFYNGGTNRVTVSVNGGTEVNVPVSLNSSGSNIAATLNTPYVITNGTVSITIKKLTRAGDNNQTLGNIQSTSNADINVTGTIIVNTNVTKTFNKRIVKLKGPTAASYTDITAANTDIYYPSGSDDNIYSAYAEITDYVRNNGVIGQYTVADMALLEGNPGGTGYSGGWSIIVVYENSKMKWRDVTIFDGYAYVESGNSSAGIELPITGFNAAQSGNVGMKIGVMASEGDIGYTSDYFKIRNLATNTYTTLSRTADGVIPSPDNFFRSYINAPGTRTPSLLNNTGIDIGIINIPNTNNSIIGNGQTSTKFLYGTNGDTYSIFGIAMSVDAYVPQVEGVITTTTINNQPAVQPYTILPGQEAGFTVDIRNIGTEAVNNYKLIIPIPFNATYVPGSAAGTVFSPQGTPTPNNISFNPSLGATGSIVWDFGTLILPVSPNGPSTLLARLTFKLKSTTDCAILSNATCGSTIAINGSSTGIGNTTSVALNNSNLIQGYTQNGTCAGEPIPTPINIGINGTAYVTQNCPNTDYTRHFSFCSASTTVAPSEIASNFPVGSQFYNTFPVTINSVQYTDANPIPLVAGSTVTYYAVPSGGSTGCNFPFTITKCPLIIAQNDALAGGNGTTGNPNIGNVLSNNGSGADTLNGVQAPISQVNITVTTPATSIGGNPVPVLDPLTGQVSVPPGTPAGTYTIIYNLCEKLNPSTNCDPATVTIIVTKPLIDAVNDTGSTITGATGGQVLANVLANDTLNGGAATLSNVNLIQVSTTNVGVTLNPIDGSVNVAPGTPSGTYTVTYQICEKINPTTNCDSAIVTVTVTNAAIDAVNDTYANIVCPTSGTIGNILANDILNGVTATISNVNLTILTGSYPSVSIDNSGNIIIAPGAPCGQYTFTYKICEKINPVSNCDNATVTVTINDNTAPTWTTVAGSLNATVECSNAAGLAAAQALFPVASDSCDNDVTNIVKVSGQFVASLTCANAGSYTNTWTVTDACGNTSAVFTQTINVQDTAAPTWTTAAGSLNATVECSNAAALAAAQALFPVAADLCDNDVTNIVKVTGQFVASSTCANAGSYSNTWTVTDACGNTSAVFTQTINVQDTAAPTWTTAAGSLNATVECSNAAGLAAAQALFPVASDLCDNDVTNIVKVSGQFVASSTCANAGSYTNTWTVTDACGNTSAVFTQTINVQDTAAPTWTTAAGSLNATVECSNAAALAAAQALFPVASDLCDNDVTNIVKVSGQFVASSNCANAGSYTNTWTVTDACGNTSAVFTQTINVQDTAAPTWTTVAGSLNATVECSNPAGLAAAQALFPVASDLCDNDVTNIVKVSGQFAASATCANAGSYTNTWTVTDACGNTSAVFTQTINVQDTTAPTWTTAAGSLNATVECSDAAGLAAAQAQFPVAADLCDADVTNIVKVSGQFVASSTCANAGSYTNTWTVTDACGNTSAVFTQTINVQDTAAPTWTTAAGSLNATVECSDAAALAAAQAQFPVAADLCDADVTNIIKVSGDFVASTTCANAGSYTNTWTVTDACGNTSAVFTQTINVQDTAAPTWTTADGSLNATVECSDAAGLAAAQAQFPVAADLCDADVTNIVKVSGQFVASSNCVNAGSYTNTWTVTDACNNTSAVFTQTINIQDTTAPTWTTAAGSLNATVECSNPAGLAAAQAQFPVASDLCDNDVTNIVKVSGEFVASANCANAGSYTNTWTVTDACGNTSAVFTQTINVQDTAAPTWTTAAGSLNATVECSDAAGLAAAQAQFPVAADLCDADVTNIVKVSGQFVASSTCANAGSYTNTWTVTDACGNTSAVFTQTINVQDTAAPTWTTADGSLNATLECSDAAGLAAAQAQFPVAADLCDADVTNIVKVSGQFVASATCANAGSYTNTWTVTDACGNTSAVFTQTINVQDTAAPTWTSAAGSLNATVECSNAAALAAAQALFPVASDLCDADVTNIVKVSGDFVASATCANAGSYTNTWTVTDACNNTSAVFTQTINVQDTTAPNISTQASNIVVECDGSGNQTALTDWLSNHGGAIASDNCSDVTWTNNFNQISGDCSAAVTITFTATDACNNSSTTTATFTVSDTSAPTFTAPANIEIFTTADCTFDASIAITGDVTNEADNCAPGIQATFVDTVANGCTGSKVITRTWSLVDACGNTAATQTQTITITDNIVPTFTAPANIEIFTTADCTYDATIAATGDVTNEADNCSTELQATFTDSVADGQCTGSHIITRTWSLVDACGNAAATQTQTITVTDNIAPTFTAPANIEIFTTADCTYDASVTATGDVTNENDNCSSELQATFTDSVADGQCAGSHIITRTWSLVDACGNAAATQTQTITVTDNIAPTFTAPANIEIFTTADCTYDATVTVTGDVTNEADNCSTGLQATFTDSVANGTCAGSYIITRTWSLVDACGNAAATQTQTITVTDNIAPTFTAPANIEIFTTTDCTFDASASITGNVTNEADNCSTELQATFTDSIADGQCPGSKIITRTWSLVDSCGNAAANQTQTITVTDNIAPTFTAPANIEIFTTADCTYDASVTATGDVTNEADNCSTELQATFTDSVADGTCTGSKIITRTWSLVDSCGNTAATQTQTITVTDNIAPIFSTQAANLVVECDGSGNQNALTDWLNNHGGAVASDNCSDVTWSNNFNNIANDCSAAVTVIFTATDACNNSSTTTATFTINDSLAPTFTAPANTEVFTTADCTYDASVTATGDVTNENDNCSTAGLQATFTDSVADGQCAGSHIITRTWSLVDACGNAAATQTQTITVTDNIAPTFTAPANIEISTTADCTYDASVTATGDVTNEDDNCSEGLQATFTDSVANGECAGSHIITRTWSLVDACGNAATTQTQTITVTDNIAPTFTAPANIEIFTTADCTYDASVAIAGDVTNEDDNCSEGLQATFTDSIADGQCAGSKIITRIWSLVDACGNTAATQTQTITVTDNIAPTFTAPANIEIFTTADCTYDASVAIAGDVTNEDDNCTTELQATFTDSIAEGACVGSKIITRTWSLVDACGNAAATQTQTITVTDNIAPTFTAPANTEVFTTADCTFDASIAITGDVTNEADNCSTGLQATFTDSIAEGACAGSKIITRTWSLVDACGNAAATQTQTITVTDNIAPTFTAPANTEIFTTADCTFDASIAITGDVTNEADNCSTGLQATFTDSIAEGACVGSKIITRTWSLVDACGNAAATQTQTITVTDNIAPTFTAPANTEVFTTADCTFDVSIAITGDVTNEADNCSTGLQATFTDSIAEGACAGSKIITRTWSLVDACGNAAATQTQTITVTDNIAPTFTAPANTEVFTTADCTFDASIAITGDVTNEADNCSTGLQATFIDSIAEGACAGSKIITRTWSLVDACGNAAATQTQTITVTDNIAPVAPQAPASITATCSGEVPAMISLTAIDNCTGAITVLGVDTTAQGACPNSFTVTRTWTFTDACNNTSSVSQTISVNDSVAPSFSQAAPANTTASCDNIPAPAVLTAIDNCGTATVNMTETILAGSCPSNYQIIRTWTATDACGNNSAPVSQTIDVSDSVGPQIIVPIDGKIAVNCDEVPVAPVLTAADFTDNCSTIGTPVFTQTQTLPNDNGTYQIVRTWTVSDACGNTTTITQSIAVTQEVGVIEINVPSTDEICNDQNTASYDLSIYLPQGTPTGGTWVNESNVGTFTGSVFSPFEVTAGSYVFSYSYETATCPQKVNVIVPVIKCGIIGGCENIIIHNAFTPNNDISNLNEFFNIEHIEDTDCYPTNSVEIYNRWGVLVYETKNYDNNSRKFIGISEGRSTVSKSEELPTGTYFYIIQWTTSEGQTVNKDGYLYLTR